MTEPLLQELLGQLSNIILGGEIDIDRFNLDMKYVNVLSAESEDNIRKKVLEKYFSQMNLLAFSTSKSPLQNEP